MKIENVKLLTRTVAVLIALELVTLVVGAVTKLSYLESFRVIFGAVYVLFLPGWTWSFVFFPNGPKISRDFDSHSRSTYWSKTRPSPTHPPDPKNLVKSRIDVIERIALSFALSIAIVPLAVFYLNLIGLPISAWSSFFVVLLLVVAGGVVVWWKSRRKVRSFID